MFHLGRGPTDPDTFQESVSKTKADKHRCVYKPHKLGPWRFLGLLPPWHGLDLELNLMAHEVIVITTPVVHIPSGT